MIALALLATALLATAFAAGYQVGACSRSQELEQLRAALGREIDPLEGQLWP